MNFEVYAYTTKYHKKNINEDAVFVNDLVISDGYYHQKYLSENFISCICDGVTGAAKGFYASQYILQSIANSEFINFDDFKHLLVDTNDALRNVGMQIKAPDMSSTMAGVYYENKRMHIFNVGDSRVYKSVDGVLTRITYDDAVAYKLFKDGVISEREIETHPQKNVLINYFGNNSHDFNVHYYEDLDFDKKVSYIIMSDGISDFLKDEKISEITALNIEGFDKIRLLVGESMNRGCNDDVSVVLVEVEKWAKRKPFC